MAFVPGFLSAILLVSAKTVTTVAKAITNRRAAQDLSAWDARALKDIGLTMGDVQGAFSLPLHRDPTDFLAHVAAGRSPVSRQGSAGAAGVSHPVETRTDRLGELPSAEPVLWA